MFKMSQKLIDTLFILLAIGNVLRSSLGISIRHSPAVYRESVSRIFAVRGIRLCGIRHSPTNASNSRECKQLLECKNVKGSTTYRQCARQTVDDSITPSYGSVRADNTVPKAPSYMVDDSITFMQQACEAAVAGSHYYPENEPNPWKSWTLDECMTAFHEQSSELETLRKHVRSRNRAHTRELVTHIEELQNRVRDLEENHIRGMQNQVRALRDQLAQMTPDSGLSSSDADQERVSSGSDSEVT